MRDSLAVLVVAVVSCLCYAHAQGEYGKTVGPSPTKWAWLVYYMIVHSRTHCCIADINECTLNIDDCDINGFCTNTDGSYTCTCNSGYNGDGFVCMFIHSNFT